MQNEETENPSESQTAQEIVAPTVENPLSELDMPVWSVISFEKRIGENLKYDDAAAMLEKLVGAKVSGLCIITNEAAEKMFGE